MIGSTVPRVALILATVTALAAGCGGPTAKPRAAAVPAQPVPAQPVAAQPVAATSTPTPWSTAPVTVVHHPPVPPVPVVTAVRYAAHPESGYDRVVFDIPGALPGYTVKYVSQVVSDGSGQPVPVPGSYYLLIVFTPAQAHTDNGTATISGTHRINLPMIKSYVVVSDYEGYVTVALGLNAKAGYHIAELSDRVYIDVAA